MVPWPSVQGIEFRIEGSTCVRPSVLEIIYYWRHLNKYLRIRFARPMMTSEFVIVPNCATSIALQIICLVLLKFVLKSSSWSLNFKCSWKNIGIWTKKMNTIIMPIMIKEDTDFRWFLNCPGVNVPLFVRLYLRNEYKDIPTQNNRATDILVCAMLEKYPISWK